MVKYFQDKMMGFIYWTQRRKMDKQLANFLWEDIQEQKLNDLKGR